MTTSSLSTAPDPTLASSTVTIPPPDAENQNFSESKKASKAKRKRTLAQTPSIPLPHSPYTYIHLAYSASKSNDSLDDLTLRRHLTSALTQFLGLHGAAISVDIMKVGAKEKDAWIRVPREDARAVVAAVGSWIGEKKNSDDQMSWTVKGWDEWLGQVAMCGTDGGQHLFGD